ncbi:PH domain-containing protein [Emericellopsis cladophorae]|uniref:PH domain-containing protein n=1 Tax=Emericellopsis cladophorae TaxID=2686198 RepID=A0A9Q0BFD9_9HYPO|nr:PH domain-containing protein [Emericellopsis cladophorae]KAI6783887.1 PH domain-containing protein [Emericellopsis cladophorae]
MDPRHDASVLPHGHEPASLPSPANSRRRLSMDEDLRYQRIMTEHPRRPSRPPPYQVDDPRQRDGQGKDRPRNGEGKAVLVTAEEGIGGAAEPLEGKEMLPAYTSSVELEGVFMKKHEIEETTKRAEERRWHTTFVTLTGTALNLYNVKKNRTWGRTKDGPSVSPDNPPWMRKAKLQKSYSLLYADAGIAADYKKRRYVIRVRAETDQFLLSCIELSTFNRWLQGLFAAIDVALPIEDRRPDGHLRRRSSSPDPLPSLYADQQETQALVNAQVGSAPVFDDEDDGVDVDQQHEVDGASDQVAAPTRLEVAHRLSTTSYSNEGVDPHDGKWVPEHRWTSAHDALYAKLCYSNLLFRSPRKSSFIIKEGKKWYVDWATGRMVRVLPPAYGESDHFGPWQVIHTDNMRL